MKRAAGLAAVLALLAAPASAEPRLAGLRGQVDAPAARDAIARVAYAEAAGQGDTGLAGVVFTILNRLASGGWGSTVEAVVNARAQFEPVMRAGGDWRALRPASPAERARIDTILNLALEGRLPDPTGGARYFQNPAIVAARARAGTVRPGLVHFGGATPSATIGDHAFYVSTGGVEAPRPDRYLAAGGEIFATQSDEVRRATPVTPGVGHTGSGDRGLFVLASGEIVEDRAASDAP